MTDPNIQARIDALHESTKALYAQKQWVVWAIGGDAATDAAPFSYTSGAVLTGRPDLYLAGVVGQAAQRLINAILQDMPENVDDAYLGVVHELAGFQTAGGLARYKLVPMTAERAREVNMHAVFNAAVLPEPQTRFCELLLADPNNKLPGEEGYVEWRKGVS